MKLKRIIIFRIGHLGDTLVSLQAFWLARKAFENEELTLLTNLDKQNPGYVAAQSVLPREKLFDKWLSFPTGLGKIATFGAFIRLLRELRKGKFDAVIYLMTRNRTRRQIRRDLLIFRLGGIRKFFGVEYLKKNLIDPLEKNPQPVKETESEFLLKCLTTDKNFPLPENIEIGPDLLLTGAEKKTAAEFLETNCGEFYKNGKILAVAPNSKWESKVWMEERFIEVVKKLIAERDLFPVIFGGPEDFSKGERLLQAWPRGANAAGRLSIREAAAALQSCVLYLGNDTGTMHLAAAVGTPCVTVFAAIDRAGRWAPYGDGHISFRRRVSCESCYAPVCFNKSRCLDLIGAEDVYGACLRILLKK